MYCTGLCSFESGTTLHEIKKTLGWEIEAVVNDLLLVVLDDETATLIGYVFGE